jgi:hypothetical protein
MNYYLHYFMSSIINKGKIHSKALSIQLSALSYNIKLYLSILLTPVSKNMPGKERPANSMGFL